MESLYKFPPFLVQHLAEVAQDYRDGIFAGANDNVEKITGRWTARRARGVALRYKSRRAPVETERSGVLAGLILIGDLANVPNVIWVVLDQRCIVPPGSRPVSKIRPSASRQLTMLEYPLAGSKQMCQFATWKLVEVKFRIIMRPRQILC